MVIIDLLNKQVCFKARPIHLRSQRTLLKRLNIDYSQIRGIYHCNKKVLYRFNFLR